jgi:hypothetical protein
MRRTMTALLTGVLLVTCVMACGDRKSESKSPNVVDSGSGRVALEYMRAIARGDFKAAVPLVARSQRAILEAVALGQGPGTLPEVTGEVSLGEVVEDGDSATVSILGKMCRKSPASVKLTSAPVTDCVENHDPKTDSPVFVVHLAKEEKAGWTVVLNFAGADKP